MRKMIIDTDVGGDDAVAIMLAVLADEVDVIGVTTVSGNCHLDLATQNALMTLEVCGRDDIPVYKGAYKPLYKTITYAVDVHGKDGMSDLDLIHPKKSAQEMHAVEYILDTVKNNPGEIEIVILGPATNIALAILKDPDTMSKVKKYISMGTPGYGPGTVTAVSEFNVYCDAESYKIMLDSKVPTLIAGIDLCFGDGALNEDEINAIQNSSKVGEFAMLCNQRTAEFMKEKRGEKFLGLPDAVTVAAGIWDDCIIKKNNVECFCSVADDPTYGQVVFGSDINFLTHSESKNNYHTDVVEKFDAKLYKKRLAELLAKA